MRTPMGRKPHARSALWLVMLSSAPLASAYVNTWGYDRYGQLGNGLPLTNAPNAVDITPYITFNAGQSAADIKTAGEHSGVRTTDGRLWMFGRGTEGQLGNGQFNNQPLPVLLSLANFGGASASALALGGMHSVAVAGGQMYTAGNNQYNQLARTINVPADAATFGLVTAQINGQPITGVTKINCGAVHNIWLQSNGQVGTFGGNMYGQLGNGATSTSSPPAYVSQLTPGGAGSILAANERVVAVEGGSQMSGVVTDAGRVITWGNNVEGGLGLGSSADVLVPTPQVVTALNGVRVTQLSCGGQHCGALSDQGIVYVWGSNDKGQLGDGTLTNKYLPQPITSFPAGTKIGQLSFGERQSGAVSEPSGIIYTWGNQQNGAIGNGQVSDSTRLPAPISLAQTPTGQKYWGGPISLAANQPSDTQQPALSIIALHGGAVPSETVAQSPGGGVQPNLSPLPGSLCPTIQRVVYPINWVSTQTPSQLQNIFLGAPQCGWSLPSPGAAFLFSPNFVPIPLPSPGNTVRGEPSVATITDMGGAAYGSMVCMGPNPSAAAYQQYGVSVSATQASWPLYHICNYDAFDQSFVPIATPWRVQYSSLFPLAVNRPLVFKASNPVGTPLANVGGTFTPLNTNNVGRMYELFLPPGNTVIAVFYEDVLSPSPLPSPSPRPSPFPSPFPSPLARGGGSDEGLLGLLGLLGLPFLCLSCCCLLWALSLLSKLKKAKACQQELCCEGQNAYFPPQPEAMYVEPMIMSPVVPAMPYGCNAAMPPMHPY